MGFGNHLVVSEEERWINSLKLERYKGILLDSNGKKTELYRKIENAYRANPKNFKERFTNNILFKTEIYVQDIVNEVLDRKYVDSQIVRVIKQEIINEASDLLNGEEKNLSIKREQLKQKLTKIRERELKKFDNEELKRIAEMIENTLNSDSVKKLMACTFENKSHRGEHSRLNLQGDYAGNLPRMEMVAKLIADYIIIHRDNSEIEEYISYLENSDLLAKGIREINEATINFHINYMRRKFPKISDDEIFNKIYDKYETNGFLFQGINGNFINSAEQNGLTGNFSAEGIKSMKRIDKIFSTHGVKNVLLSKLHEIKTDTKYYYVTDNFREAKHFSIHNPEYMSMLFGNGPYLNDEEEFDRLAFYMRDMNACIKNVKKLCARYSISKEEESEILDIATRALNGMSNMQHNGILITPKKMIKKTSNSKPNEEGDLKTKLLTLLDCRRINNYRCYIDIPSKAVSIIKVAPLQQILKGISDSQERNNIRKFIQVKSEDGNIKPLYYDIFIKSADASDLDCICFQEGEGLPVIESLMTNDYPLTVDAIKCSPNHLQELDILKSDSNMTQPSFQSLMMMIAVNGVANSEEGKQLLNRARKEFTPKKMSQYYYFVAEKLTEIATDNTYSSNIRLQVAKRIIGDLLPKAIYMDQANRYPVDICPDQLLATQYDSFQGQLVMNKLTSLQVEPRGEKIDLRNGFEGLMCEVKEVFEQYYSFDESYRDMSKSWLDKLNFEQELQQYNEEMSQILRED